MAQFDVQNGWSVSITSSRDAFYEHRFRVARRKALSGAAWQDFGGWFDPNSAVFCGPLPNIPDLEYQIVAEFRRQKAGGGFGPWQPAQERTQDDGAVAVFYYEDAEDADFNDLIIVCKRMAKITSPSLLGECGEQYIEITVPDGGQVHFIPSVHGYNEGGDEGDWCPRPKESLKGTDEGKSSSTDTPVKED